MALLPAARSTYSSSSLTSWRPFQCLLSARATDNLSARPWSAFQCRGLTIRSRRSRFAARLNSGVRPVHQHSRTLILVIWLLATCVGCEKQPMAECPKDLSALRMPDLPPTKGFYQGTIDASYTIQKSGKASDILVRFPDLRLDGEPTDLGAATDYAVKSLRSRQFPKRDTPCVVKLSAWLN